MFNECLQDLPIRHLLDVMHVEWNICDNKIYWNVSLVKNTPSMLGRTWRRQGLCQICNGGINLVSWHISNLMHCTFLHMMKKIISWAFDPYQICLYFQKKHVRNRIIGLKSHDMHVMVQQILHVCVRHLMHPAQRHAIHAQRVGKIFQRLCSKITDPIDLPSLKLYILEMFAYWRVVFRHPFLTSWNIY
jgi:hypothetical protein